MGEGSKIEWTDHTFNPWWGCTRVSPACDHCYAETFAKRTGHDVWGRDGDRRTFGDKHWSEPVRWNEKAKAEGVRRRVFCASMADVFEDRPDLDGERARLWDLIDDTPSLDWLLLTKRPENIQRMYPSRWHYRHPQANVWLGTTVENQRYADLRIPKLLQVPAAVHFLSCEPLLGAIDLNRWLHDSNCWIVDDAEESQCCTCAEPREVAVGWVIAGGESGAGHRPMDIDWPRALRDQCVAAGVPFLFKQWGGRTPKAGGRELDGRTWDEVPA